jgi:hypothetical protein
MSASPKIPVHEHLIVDPHFFLFNLDLDKSSLQFIEIDEQALRGSPFHDRRISNFSSRRAVQANIRQIDAALQARGANRPKINYLFHTAFCCSTLISRSLDIPGVNLCLREPEILMTLANHRRMRHGVFADRRQGGALLASITRLLNKSFAPDEQVLIKPTNAANNLLPDIVQAPTTGKVVLLYSNLERFLISIMRKGEACRAFARRLFNVLSLDERPFDIPQRTLMEFTDLQIAAVVWHMQITRYRQQITASPDAPLRTLNCDTFLERPREMLSRLVEFYGLAASAEQIEAIVTGPVFNRDSKNATRAYDRTLREAEYAETKERHAQTLRWVMQWAQSVGLGGGTTLQLPNAL